MARTPARRANGLVRVAFDPGLGAIAANLVRYGEAAFDAVEYLFEATAREAQGYMKANHRWVNRTGAAERGLVARVVRRPDGWTLELESTAPHGPILERRPDLAIVRPTAELYGPRLIAGVRDIF